MSLSLSNHFEHAESHVSKCIVCGGSELKSLYPVRDTNQGVPGTWNILECRQCGLGIIDPFPSSEEISEFYINRFYTKDGKRFQSWMENLRALLARLRGLHLNRIAPGKGRLLDFGAGAGHFAKAQSSCGWEVNSIDPYSGKGNCSGESNGEDQVRLEFPDAYFDAITLWYVIEHLRDPEKAIAEFSRVLKPGGILVLAQQDFSSRQARFFRQRWLILDPPRHLWQFSEANLIKLSDKFNFKKHSILHSSIELGPFTILQSILNCIIGNENYLFRFLKNRNLSYRDPSRKVPTFHAMISIFGGIALLPISFGLYYLLLIFGSGDIFTLYLRKEQMTK